MKPAHPLKIERELRGWSLAKVAAAVGTNVRTLIRWEQGQSVPFPYFREQLCALFAKNVRELGFLVQDESASPAQTEQDEFREDRPSIDLPAKPLVDPTLPVVLQGSGRLIGREPLLKQVEQWLLEDQRFHAIALQGLPGMGKTALALALATLPTIREHFCDGVLWAGLGQKPDLLGHLARWGKLLGIAPSAVENVTSQASWGQALRAAMGPRRFLLVIDDAWNGEEALALHVGGEHCTHLLTSRLPQVAFACAGERTLVVPELPEADGLALLARPALQGSGGGVSRGTRLRA